MRQRFGPATRLAKVKMKQVGYYRFVILVFLDFDGVLRRNTSPLYRLEPHLVKNFESVILPTSGTNIVITSSWREAYGLGELKRLFSAELAERIVGVTPISRTLREFYRYEEILAYLKRRAVGPVRWLAIDDDPLHYPPGSPVLLTDPGTGFDSAAAQELAQILKGPD